MCPLDLHTKACPSTIQEEKANSPAANLWAGLPAAGALACSPSLCPAPSDLHLCSGRPDSRSPASSQCAPWGGVGASESLSPGCTCPCASSLVLVIKQRCTGLSSGAWDLSLWSVCLLSSLMGSRKVLTLWIMFFSLRAGTTFSPSFLHSKLWTEGPRFKVTRN